MNVSPGPDPQYHLTCRHLGRRPTSTLLEVSVARQQVCVWRSLRLPRGQEHSPAFRLLTRWRCSTSRFGLGQTEGSNATPLGLHQIGERHGLGQPAGGVYRGRVLRGWTWAGQPEAPIAHRILWLEGLEPGFNRGGQCDSRRRYIYIHGVGDEPGLGRPASHGCVHLAARDLIPLADWVPRGSHVWIHPGTPGGVALARRRAGKGVS